MAHMGRGTALDEFWLERWEEKSNTLFCFILLHSSANQGRRAQIRADERKSGQTSANVALIFAGVCCIEPWTLDSSLTLVSDTCSLGRELRFAVCVVLISAACVLY